MNDKSPILDWTGQPVAYSTLYEGANFSRHRTHLPYNVGDSKQTVTPYTRKQMMSHARYLYANFGFIKGAVDDIALYSVGNGINTRSQISNPEIRLQYDSAWEAWKNIADYYGVFHFDTIQDLSSRAIDVDGDPGAVLAEDEEGQARVQMIEAHRIDDCGEDDSSDGIVLDKKGRPVFVRIKEDSAKGFTEVPYGRFIHLFDPERLDERCRSKTALHHAINNSRDALDILNYEKVAVKENSSVTRAIKTTSGEVGAGFFSNPSQTTTAGGQPITLEKLRAGALPRLAPGEEIWTHNSDRPSTAFTGFLDYLDRDVALGLGVPVQFFHCSDMGGTPQRFVMRKAERKFSKRAMIILRFVRRVRFFWAAKEIKRGALPYVEDWYKVRPEFPATASVDIGREAQQNREDLRFGNRTLAMDAGEQGLDWREDIRQQIQYEGQDLIDRVVAVIKYAKDKHGIELSFDQAKSFLGDKNNGNAPVTPVATQEDLAKTKGKK